MSYHPCVSGCGRFLALRTVTIAASRVWAARCGSFRGWFMFFFKREKKRKGDISELRIDSAVSNMAESLCLCRDSAFVLAPGVALHPVESEVIEGHGEGFPRGVLTPQALRSRWGCRWSGLGPLQNGVHRPFPSVLPLTTRCRSLHRRVSSLSPGMTTRLRCPLRVW